MHSAIATMPHPKGRGCWGGLEHQQFNLELVLSLDTEWDICEKTKRRIAMCHDVESDPCIGTGIASSVFGPVAVALGHDCRGRVH